MAPNSSLLYLQRSNQKSIERESLSGHSEKCGWENGCEYNWKMVGLSERGWRSSKKTSKPGSVLHSTKKSMLLVFSVFAVRTSLEVRRAVCCAGGWRVTMQGRGARWARWEELGPQLSLGCRNQQPTTALHITLTTVVHIKLTNVNFKLHSLLSQVHTCLCQIYA